ncbi:dephospho-CoA kinase [Candidatus Parabeggiatoa sp. HSG14]|uniref:dephospho-CoA kinase n=1 Tax=Candidatus Parabeggiatoa sp. HSG14 TaxID=3055593 RepID=UPI0025A79E03|nr:dephospho-CoA kinase [Thiotrichales bacterium HSG14]
MSNAFKMLPIRVGLTGGIASGKTSVSNLFAQIGIPIIDADVIAHALVKPGQPTLERVVQTFGTSIIDDTGCLKRAELRQQVFKDSLKRQQLEAILHPPIFKAMEDQWQQLPQITYCIFSIPLLLETQQWDRVDRVLVVDCEKKLQRQRLMRRNGISQQQVEEILNVQTDRETRLGKADDVIDNNENLESLQLKVNALHRRYLELKN